MVDTYNREQISELVVGILRELHFRQDISEESRYGEDLVIDEGVNKLYYYAIVLHLQKSGLILNNFSVEDCERAETVTDIIDAVWSDIKDRT
jgi:hypothetical protein